MTLHLLSYLPSIINKYYNVQWFTLQKNQPQFQSNKPYMRTIYKEFYFKLQNRVFDLNILMLYIHTCI